MSDFNTRWDELKRIFGKEITPLLATQGFRLVTIDDKEHVLVFKNVEDTGNSISFDVIEWTLYDDKFRANTFDWLRIFLTVSGKLKPVHRGVNTSENIFNQRGWTYIDIDGLMASIDEIKSLLQRELKDWFNFDSE